MTKREQLEKAAMEGLIRWGRKMNAGEPDGVLHLTIQSLAKMLAAEVDREVVPVDKT